MKNLYENINILIIGDSCKDVFKYGHVPRIAPEGPAPVFNPICEKSNGGMALNVKANIEAIGANATLLTQPEKITKIRYVDERTNSLLIRVDEEQKVSEMSYSLMEEITNNQYNGMNFDAIIISDYCKGFLSEIHICEISHNNKNVFLDRD